MSGTTIASTRETRLGLGILIAQLRRSAMRAAVGAVAAYPVLFVATHGRAEWIITLVTCGWTLFHVGMTIHHARSLPHVGGSPVDRALLTRWLVGGVAAVGVILAWPLLVAPAPVGRPVLLTTLPVLTVTIAGLAVAVSRSFRPPVVATRERQPGALSTEQAPLRAEPLTAQTHQGMAIACSGGGIRAAAFCLGALQRLRTPTSPGGTSIYDRTDRVYGVSGGSYIATALHLGRRQSRPIGGGQAPADLFAPNSAEADWLRCKSSYLLPNSQAWFRGLASLLFGLLSNLSMVLAGLWLFIVYAVWLLASLPGTKGLPALAQPYARFEPSPVIGRLAVGAVIVAAGWMLIAKTISKYSRGRLAPLIPSNLGVAVAITVSVALLLIPATLTVLHNAAVTNQPTNQVAKLIAGVGLVDQGVCATATREDFARQAVLAWHRTPGAADQSSIPFTYGACGNSYTDNAANFPDVVARPASVLPACPGPGSTAATIPANPIPALCDPARDTTGGWAKRFAGTAALLTALLGLLRSMKGQSEQADTRRSKLVNVLRARLAPWLAATIVVGLLGLVALRFGRALLINQGLINQPWTWVIPIGIFAATRVLTDATMASLHPFYRERLSSTFLIRRDPEDNVDRPVHWNRDTGLVDPPDLSGPALSVLCVANIQDADYVPAQRGCVSFRFETGQVDGLPTTAGAGTGLRHAPYIGTTDSRLPALTPLSVPADQYARRSDPSGSDTTLSAAIAASGAAFSPVIGRLSKRVLPYRFLMTLANARLGVWLLNPYVVLVKDPIAGGPPPLVAKLWDRLVYKPGPFRIFKEAFGHQSIDDSRIYITDGGHFDNTGMVEALRDRPRTLIVLDASADAVDSLDALADAMTTARMDLGLVIRPAQPDSLAKLRGDPATPGALPERGWARLAATYLDDPDTVVCDIYFVKNVLPRSCDLELTAYRAEHPEFPNTSTVNQFYGEYDFEAYRQLGFLNVTDLLGREPISPRMPVPAAVLDGAQFADR